MNVREARERALCKLRDVPYVPSLLERGLTLGENVAFQRGSYVDWDFPWLITIGSDTVLAPRATVLSHDASMQKHLGYTKIAEVHIGSRVFLGAGSIVLPGVTIGDGSIIGAGSVVRKDVPADSLVVGNPAEVVGPTTDYLNKQQANIDKWLNDVDERDLTIDAIRRGPTQNVRSRISGRIAGYVR
jgi:maltose O-acetyltransferase